MAIGSHLGFRLPGKVATFFLVTQLLPVGAGPWSGSWGATPLEASTVTEKMQAAYAEKEQYQCETEVREYRNGRLETLREFLYSFKKPDRVRIDLRSPYRGMTLIYPDREGKVLVKPGGPHGLFRFHLSPGNALLRSGHGQRIDQTDLGRLIENIGRSLAEWRRGEPRIEDQGERVLVEVLSRDHFLPEVETLYRFYLDKKLWLPVEVEEFTPDGVPKRRTLFRDLHPTDLPDEFFNGE